MLMGHSISFHEPNDSRQLLLEVEAPTAGGDEEDRDSVESNKVLYKASFEELASKYLQYETVIWVLISLLLVLAWGIGLLMLIYLPIRRHILKKDIYSRRLYITPHEIIYKVTRPSFLPYFGCKKIENRIQLHLLIDIIIEQGCLQAAYGIHTFRIESVASGNTAVNELQFQGVSNPELLRKVIVSEAAKSIQEVRACKRKSYVGDGKYVRTHTDVLSTGRLYSPTNKLFSSTLSGLEVEDLHNSYEECIPSEILLLKLEEVSQSVKKIESLVRTQPLTEG